MTIENIINQLGNYPSIILIYFGIMLGVSLLGLLLVKEQNYRPPINYLYGGLVYLVAIPGLLSVVLLLYSFFFLKTNVLQLNIVTHYVPIVFMIATLLIINRTIPLKRIPGFDRLSGLVILITGAFILTFILQRMIFGVFFIGSFTYLIAFFGLILLGLKIGWNKLKK